MAGDKKTRSRAFARKAAHESDRRVLGKHVDEFIRNANRVFAIFGASDRVQLSFELQMREHLLKTDYAGYVSQAKAFCAYARAVQLDNEVPNFSLEFSGRFRRWFRRRLNVKCARNRHFCNSVWNLKNTAATLHHKEVKRLLDEHAVEVQKDFDVELELVEEFLGHLKPVLSKVAERASEIFEEKKLEMYQIPGSNKASLESPASSGGEVGELIRSCFPEGSPVCPDFPLNHPQVRSYMCGSSLDTRIWEESDVFKLWYEAQGFHWSDYKKRAKEIIRFCEVDYTYQTTMPELRYCPAVIVEGVVEVGGLVELIGDELVEVPSYLPTGELHLLAPSYYEEFVVTEECPEGFWRRATISGKTRHDFHNWWTEAREEPVVVGYEVVDDCLTGDFESQPIVTYPRCSELWIDYVDRLIAGCDDLPTSTWWDYEPSDYDDGWDPHPSQVRRVVAVCEPLKVRVITVGPAEQKYLLGIWQQCVHGALKEVPGFQLLGAPPTTADIEAILPGIDGTEVISSGDFKGASNGTAIRLNLGLCHEVSRRLPTWLKRVAASSCLPHLLIYGPMKTAIQRIGTLMGERTSFPLLSLTVAGAVVLAARRNRVKLSVWEILRRVRNNGDDLVFRSTKVFADSYWEVTRELGFTKSVGKSYEHAHYANINSASFWVGDVVTRERGLFSGLFCGKKKLATDEFRPGQVVTELLDSCFDAKMEHAVMKAYLKMHGKRLNWELGGRNLFVSGLLGGMGQRKPNDIAREGKSPIQWQVQYSEEQRRVAAHMLKENPHLRKGARFGRPLSGLAPRKAPWDVEGTPTYWEIETKMRRQVYGEGPSTLSINEYMLSKGHDVRRTPPLRHPGRPVHLSDFVRPGSIPDPPCGWCCQVCGELNPPPDSSSARCSLCEQLITETIRLQVDPTFFGPVASLPRDDRGRFTSWSYFERIKSSMLAVGPPPKVRRVLVGDQSPKRLLARF